MLTSDQLDVIPNNVLKLYREFEDSVVSDIVRRLVKMDYATPTSAWQMQRLIETTAVYEDVIKKLSEITGKSEKELVDTFTKAGVKSIKFDDSIYKAAGLDPLPLNMSPQMTAVLANGLRTTNNLMRNITQSTALSAQRQFIAASDLAYLQVSSGAFSYDQAIRAAVKSVGESGLGVVYPSGRVDKLDVAVRRAVLTGVSKTSGDLQWARADEMGQDLVETSAHIGARPEHQAWQGQIYSRSGTNKKYPDFVSSTGYGTVTGLLGVNCRHSFYPYFEGISKAAYDKAELESYSNKKVTYQGKEITVYEATQKQRAIERKIREWKRQEVALKSGGLDATFETGKIKEWQGRMRSFIKETGLQRQSVREQVYSGSVSTVNTQIVSAPIIKPPENKYNFNDGKPYFRYTHSPDTPMSQWGTAMFADEKARVSEHFSYGKNAWKFSPNNSGGNILGEDKFRPILEKEVKKLSSGEYLDFYDLQKQIESGELTEKQLVDAFFPKDIVTGAEAYDDSDIANFLGKIVEDYEIDAVITPDGAVVFNEKLITRSIKDDWGDYITDEKPVPIINKINEIAMAEYKAYLQTMKIKYGEALYANMTDAELELLEALERKAHSK